MPEVGLVALPPDAWGGYWGSRHHMLTGLAAWFHVVWVDPPRHWRTSAWPARSGRAAPGGAPPATPGFARYTPPRWLPHFYRPARLARAADRARWLRAADVLARRGCRRTVLDLWKPHHASALDAVPHDLSCYHITDEYTYAEQERPIDPAERALIARVDQVFILSRASFEKKARYNPHSLFLPSGVDYEAFSGACPEPRELAAIPRPRIGYVGLVKRHLDFDLLLALAERHREWSFVLVGPDGYLGDRAAAAARFRSLRNVHALGGRPREALPAYDQHLDVCVLCYATNGYTKFVNPLKLREYLASGRPVVGSALPSFEEFRDVIEIARTPDQWSAAIARALEPAASAPARVEARRRVARGHDWSLLVDRMAEAVCERLGGATAERFLALRAAARRPAGRAPR
jgi:glycosyltransferase involved in cell wall biosynthesis